MNGYWTGYSYVLFLDDEQDLTRTMEFATEEEAREYYENYHNN